MWLLKPSPQTNRWMVCLNTAYGQAAGIVSYLVSDLQGFLTTKPALTKSFRKKANEAWFYPPQQQKQLRWLAGKSTTNEDVMYFLWQMVIFQCCHVSFSGVVIWLFFFLPLILFDRPRGWSNQWSVLQKKGRPVITKMPKSPIPPPQKEQNPYQGWH